MKTSLERSRNNFQSLKPKYSKRKLFKCHLVHHKSHTGCPYKIIFKSSVSTSEWKQCVSNVKDNRLTLYTKIMDLYLENQKKQTNSVRSKQSLSTVEQMVFIITTECLAKLRKPWGIFTVHTVEINESLSKGSSCRLSRYCKIRETHLLGPDLTVLPVIPPPSPFPHDVRGNMYADAPRIFGQPKGSRFIDSAAQDNYTY